MIANKPVLLFLVLCLLFSSLSAQWVSLPYSGSTTPIMVKDSIGYAYSSSKTYVNKDEYDFIVYKTTADWGAPSTFSKYNLPGGGSGCCYSILIDCIDEGKCFYARKNVQSGGGFWGGSIYYSGDDFVSNSNIGSLTSIYSTTKFNNTIYLTGIFQNQSGVYQLDTNSLTTIYSSSTLNSGYVNPEFVTPSTGFVFMLDSNNLYHLLKTTDAGANWSTVIPASPKVYTSIDFTDSLNGYITTDIGEIYHSTDGGLNWNFLSRPTTQRINQISFSNDSTALIVGDNGLIFRTTNRGLNWSSEFSGTNSQLFTIQYAGHSEYISGASVFLKSNRTVTGLKDELSPKLNNLIAIVPNPSKNKVTIELGLQNKLYSFSIFDSKGKLITTGNSKTFDVSNYSTGIYLILISTTQGTASKRLVKN